MDTKIKTIFWAALMGCGFIFLAGCGKKRAEMVVDSSGKPIPISFKYPRPFKLGDTVWIKYQIRQEDVGDGMNINNEKLLIADFIKSSVAVTLMYKDVKSGQYRQEGKYVDVFGNDSANKGAEYNPATNRLEANYGYIPGKKGVYKIDLHLIQASIFYKEKNYRSVYNFIPYLEEPREEAFKVGNYFEIKVE